MQRYNFFVVCPRTTRIVIKKDFFYSYLDRVINRLIYILNQLNISGLFN